MEVEDIPVPRDDEESRRWQHLVDLDDELLRGGIVLSEWCTLLVREADIAFVKGAHLAAILTAVCGIETLLRAEGGNGHSRLSELIDHASLPADLKLELQSLRRYRNRWVHLRDPWDDEELQSSSAGVDEELTTMAFKSARLLRRVLYANPWV